MSTDELEESQHKNRRTRGRMLVELSRQSSAEIPWRRRYCAPPDIKMPVIDVCTVSAERAKERERETERPRYAIRRGNQWDARYSSPPKRHLTKIRGCHNRVILRLPAGTTLLLCDRGRGMSAAERKKGRKIERHLAQSVYLYPRKSFGHCVSERTQPT